MEVWADWHDALWWALDGFHLGRSAPGTIEEMLVHDGPLLGFAVPGSWDARGRGSEGEAEGLRERGWPGRCSRRAMFSEVRPSRCTRSD